MESHQITRTFAVTPSSTKILKIASPKHKFKNISLWLYPLELISYTYEIYHNDDKLDEGFCKSHGSTPFIITYKSFRDFSVNQKIIIYINNLSTKGSVFNCLSLFFTK